MKCFVLVLFLAFICYVSASEIDKNLETLPAEEDLESQSLLKEQSAPPLNPQRPHRVAGNLPAIAPANVFGQFSSEEGFAYHSEMENTPVTASAICKKNFLGFSIFIFAILWIFLKC